MFSSHVLLSLAAIVVFVFLLRSLHVGFRIGMNELLLKQVGFLFCTVAKAGELRCSWLLCSK